MFAAGLAPLNRLRITAFLIPYCMRQGRVAYIMMWASRFKDNDSATTANPDDRRFSVCQD